MRTLRMDSGTVAVYALALWVGVVGSAVVQALTGLPWVDALVYFAVGGLALRLTAPRVPVLRQVLIYVGRAIGAVVLGQSAVWTAFLLALWVAAIVGVALVLVF